MVDGDVAYIPLAGDRAATLDAADVGLAAAFSWTAVFRARRIYALGMRGRVRVYLHRLVLGVPSGVEVDHRNLDGLDCRRANLRVASRSMNNANQEKVTKTTASRFKGVHLQRRRGRVYWCAQVKVDGQPRRSYHATEEAAARAYDAMARSAFGDFARLNFT